MVRSLEIDNLECNKSHRVNIHRIELLGQNNNGFGYFLFYRV